MKIYQTIKEQILSGSIPPGEKLPTETELQNAYGCSRDTLRKALGKLELDGLIVRKAALGTFVRKQKSTYPLYAMHSFTEQMKIRGVEPSSEILSVEILEAGGQKDGPLPFTEGEKIYRLARIRKGDGEPMALEIAFISKRCCPDLLRHLSENASLYHIYENIYGLKMHFGDIRLEAEIPNAHVQKRLQIKSNMPVLKMNCTVDLDNGDILYHVICYYIGDKYVFSTKLLRETIS